MTPKTHHRAALRVALVYAAFASAWILLSDRTLGYFLRDPAQLLAASTAKGWLFVLLTSALLYALVARLKPATAADTPLDPPRPRAAWALALGLSASVAVLVAMLVYRQESADAKGRTDIYTRMKAGEVGLWLREREADARFLESSTFLGDLLQRWRAGEDSAGRALAERLEHFRALKGYDTVIVADLEGRIALRLGSDLPLDEARLAEEVARTVDRHARLVDLAPAAAPHAGLDTIAMLPRTARAAGAALVLRTDPEGPALAMLRAPGPEGAGALLLRHDERGVRLVARGSAEPLDAEALRYVANHGEDGGALNVERAGGRGVVANLAALPVGGLRLVSVVPAEQLLADANALASWSGVGTFIVACAGLGGALLLRQGQRLRLEALRQREAAERLHALELLDAIVEASSDVIFAKDRNGRYLLHNREATRQAGKTREEVLGHDDNAIFPAPQALAIRENDERVMRAGRSITFEETVTTVDGERHFLSTKGPLLEADGTVFGLFGISRDITARRRAEDERRAINERLAESETLHRSMVSALHEGVMIFSPDGAVLAANASAERILGIDMARIVATHPRLADWRAVREDGTRFPIESLPVALALSQGTSQRGVVLGITDDAGEVSWLEVNAEPVRDPDGTVNSAVCSFTDITARRLAERELARHREMLEKAVAERTAQLGRTVAKLESFSYTISHDLRAPLRAINGYASILELDAGPELSAPNRELVGRVIRAAQRMDELLEDIHQFSKSDRAELVPEPLDLEAIARDVVEQLRPSYPATTVEIGPLPRLTADATAVRQILANLVGNALKFSGKAPQPRVWVRGEDWEGEDAIVVADNGAGFDMRYANQLFGLFKRLHRESEFPGTGVGLAIVKNMVERQGGRIDARAEPGRGAVFRFTLGAAARAAPREATAPS